VQTPDVDFFLSSFGRFLAATDVFRTCVIMLHIDEGL